MSDTGLLAGQCKTQTADCRPGGKMQTEGKINSDNKKRGQDFRTGPYLMHTLLCFKKTIAITIDVLWNCGALFFLFRGFFSKSIWT